MRGQEIFGDEILAAGMACACLKTHSLSQAAVGRLALHRASGIISCPVPKFHAARRGVDVAAQAALVRLLFLFEAIEMVSHKTFRHGDVDLSLGLLDKLLPTPMTRIWRGGRVFGIEAGCLVFDHCSIAGKI